MLSCIEILVFVYSGSAMEKICKEHINTIHTKLICLINTIDVSDKRHILHKNNAMNDRKIVLDIFAFYFKTRNVLFRVFIVF